VNTLYNNALYLDSIMPDTGGLEDEDLVSVTLTARAVRDIRAALNEYGTDAALHDPDLLEACFEELLLAVFRREHERVVASGCFQGLTEVCACKAAVALGIPRQFRPLSPEIKRAFAAYRKYLDETR